MGVKKRITIGILAHVDAGKTTLSEALLTASGTIAKAGRVDSGSSFLDTDEQERSRGITIFAGQARLQAGETELTLVDAPGHVDFSAEMERTLSVLDYAVMVVCGRQLVQSHTVTIWKLLQRAGIPVFVFVNKMDLEGTDPGKAMEALRAYLDDGCVKFCAWPEGQKGSAPDAEELAMRDERLLDTFLAEEELPRQEIVRAIAQRKIFPVWFGSALKQQGVRELLSGLDLYTRQPPAGNDFSARVFRITRDRKGTRLT
ncbi:MAG: GTP-binding protein, partial [Lachnospiraceae bacterium]|nr:GTP-binding protein [Lachnospiraceae bacterium]